MADGSISRTLRVLEAVCAHGPQTLKALSARTELAPPTLLRILRLMAAEGYVSQQPDRTWRGTMLVYRLGCAVNETVGIDGIAREHVERLTALLDETSVYAVYEQDAVTYAAHAEPNTPVRAHVRLGRQHGLLATSTGKAVLAWLGEEHFAPAIAMQREAGEERTHEDVAREMRSIRELGYASGHGRRWPDMWGAAAPVFAANGDVVGALGVSIPSTRLVDGGANIIAAVAEEAHQMSRQLGYSAPITSEA